MQRFCEEIDIPVMANMVVDVKTPWLTADKLNEMWFDLAILPNSMLRTAMQTVVDAANRIKEAGTTADITDEIADFALRNELTDKDDVDRLEKRYS